MLVPKVNSKSHSIKGKFFGVGIFVSGVSTRSSIPSPNKAHYGISSFSHPDNALEVCGLLTPLHIVPEWYFLCQYSYVTVALVDPSAEFL